MKSLPVSADEARRILGKDAVGMSDDEITEVIQTLDLMAKEALERDRAELRRKKDAKALANLIYDVYQDEKRTKTRRKKSD